jgi:hypothetical protein
MIIFFSFCEDLNIYIQILPIINLLDITLKFHIITMFVIVDIQTACHTICGGIFMIESPLEEL